MMNFCTLFDSGYLDKGIVLCRSLKRHCKDYRIYVFCFDDKSHRVLTDLQLPGTVILHHSCFETKELLRLKGERSKAEYCWTCTPVIIEYVLSNYPVEGCTYLDADLCFYDDPALLFAEPGADLCDALITPHRFKDDDYGRHLEKRNGKYCVEFNFFRNNENGRQILSWWKEKCFEWCADIPEPDRMGDQKYLERFPELFTGVHVLKHPGGGLAPWNLEKYSPADGGGLQGQEKMVLVDAEYGTFSPVFYHFQNMRYISDKLVNIKSQTKDRRLKYPLYIPYLAELEKTRRMLMDEYGVGFAKGIVRSGNPLLGLMQKYFAAWKLQSFSDLIRLDRLDEYLRKL